MQVSDIMSRNVVTVSANDTFADAAKILHEHKISSVIVQGEGGPGGIVTERDFVNLVSEGQDPSNVKVSDRMTKDLATVESKSDIAEAAKVMAERRIRHLPVVDKGDLVGIISIRDLTSCKQSSNAEASWKANSNRLPSCSAMWSILRTSC